MKNEFVTYEQALALKELGFDEPCLGYWNRDPYLPKPTFNLVKSFDHEWCIPAPLYQQAFRWFREKYKLHSYIYSDYSWNISGGIWDLNGYKDLRYDWDSEPYATYEEAESACLDKLIEIAKK